MSQFDRYDNPELQRECDWEVFIDKEHPNIVNVRFGRYKEITIPPKFQWEEGQYIKFLDIDSEKIQECDFSVNGVLDATIHYVNDGLVEIPNSIFTHHGNARVFVKHVGEDNITVVKVISFIVNRREKPQEYVSPDDEQTFRQWVQEQLDEGLIADITEIPSTEDDGLNIITITMRDGYEYVFTVKNGSKGDPGPGVAEGGVTGQILVKKSDEDYDTEWVEIPTSVNVVQEEGQSTEDVMSQKAVSDSLESIRENKMDKDTDAVEDNIAIFDANGNVVDSGVNLDNIQVECDDHLDTESENPVQNKVLADIIPYKADYSYVNDKVDEINAELNDKADVSDLPSEVQLVPEIESGDAGKILAVNGSETGTEWSEIPKELPSTSISDAGKFLSVNNAGTGVEWANTPSELPSVSGSDNGKLLGVASGTWQKVDAPKELPSYAVGDSGKVLSVNSTGTGVEWNTVESSGGIVAHTGSGAPTGNIVAAVGDLYRDTTNNKLYQCTQYVDPSSITTLAGLTAVFNTTIQFEGTVNYSYSVNFTSNNNTYSDLWWNNYAQQILYYASTPADNAYNNGAWVNEAFRTVHFIDGIHICNSEFINKVLSNATIANVGSSWTEVTAIPDGIPTANGQDDGKVLKVLSNAWVIGDESNELPSVTSTDNGKVLQVSNGAWSKETIPVLPSVTVADEGKVLTVNSSGVIVADNVPTELPAVTSADEGKVLTVDSQGTWFAGNSSSGSVMHTGYGVPTAVIVASVGEYYTDLNANKSYVCTNYIDPSVTITDLTGKTFYFNEKLSVDDIIEVIGEIPDPTTTYNKEYSVTYTSPDKNTSVQRKLSFGWRPSASYYVMMSETNGTMYETYNGGSWYNSGNQRRIKFDMFDAGTDKSNADLITFITRNAILDNTGSTWAEVVATPVTNTPQQGSLVQYDSGLGKWQATQNGTLTITNPNSTSYYSQMRGGTDFVIYQGNNLCATYGTDFREVRFRMNSTNHYLANMSLKTLLGAKDNAVGYITNGTNLNSSYLCSAGQSGYITSSIAGNLINCPTEEGFVMTVIHLNQQYISVTKNVIGIRIIVTDSGAMFSQTISSDNSASWTYGQWTPMPKSLSGSGAPSSSIVAGVGDIYTDTNTGKIYRCSNYISQTITTLEGKTATFNSSIDFSNISSGAKSYTIAFTCNGNSYNNFFINQQHTAISYDNGSTFVYESGAWVSETYRTITFGSTGLVTNTELIKFVTANATIANVGSTWVEVVAKDDRVPDAPTTDGNYVLKCSVSSSVATYTWDAV